MSKQKSTAKLAEINDPAPKQPSTTGQNAPDRRTVSPTPTEVKSDTEETEENLVDAARETAAQQAKAAKDAAAATASEQADRVREAGESFEAGSFAQAASERLADNLSEAARSIQNADLGQLTDDLAAFARRQPLMFFGGAALLGFAAGRLMKASERAEPAAYDASGYDGRVS